MTAREKGGEAYDLMLQAESCLLYATLWILLDVDALPESSAVTMLRHIEIRA